MEEIYVTEGNDSVKDTPWVVSGFDRIDKLAGGMRRGEMNIFVAKSREPKTKVGALTPDKIFFYDPEACITITETAREQMKNAYDAMREWHDKLREQAVALNSVILTGSQGGAKTLHKMLYLGPKHYEATITVEKPVDHLQAIRDIVGAGL
jgi:hypothetical protein